MHNATNHTLLRRIGRRALLGFGAVLAGAALVLLAAGVFTVLPGEETTPSGARRSASTYIPMRDGVRIAVDVWLPPDYRTGQRLPALMNMTRYWRDREIGFLGRALTGLGIMDAAADRRRMLSRIPDGDGYVIVRVDARGSGASFGTRPVEWSPDEIADYGEIADWIVRQLWSNGQIGAFGVSYEANTAELMALNRHPAIKALAPLYGDYDPQLGLTMPGGVRLRYIEMWGRRVALGDRNDICALASVTGLRCWLNRSIVSGVKPVDAADGHELLRQAIAEHDNNLDVNRATLAVEFSDDPIGDTNFSIAQLAPVGLEARIEASGLPLWVAVSWLDAATVDGALLRFLRFDNPQMLVIGPYSHGGEFDVDPFAPVDQPAAPPLTAQYLQRNREFFDCYLKTDAGCAGSAGIGGKQIRYYTMGEGAWHETSTWPPAELTRKRFYFGPDFSLTAAVPSADDGLDRYAVDFSASTGDTTRWHTNMFGSDVIYPNRAEEDRKLLVYTGAPLEQDVEITGAPVLSLQLSSTHTDGAFIAYLEAVAPDGQVTYITEGVLRGVNRKPMALTPEIEAAFGVGHSYRRSDAKPLIPGKIAQLDFSLFSTSVLLRKGYRIRVALAGADQAMFLRLPEDGTPEWTVYRSAGMASFIELPMKLR